MASPSPSSSHPSRTSRPSRPRLRVGLVCLCSAALLAVSALPNARASNLAGHELPQGVDWAVGDGVEVMTSSWTAGSSLGRRAVGALVDETDSDATHSRHSSSSRRVTAKATGSDVVDIRMAATAASVESVETSTITEAAAGETSAGVQAAVGPPGARP